MSQGFVSCFMCCGMVLSNCFLNNVLNSFSVRHFTSFTNVFSQFFRAHFSMYLRLRLDPNDRDCSSPRLGADWQHGIITSALTFPWIRPASPKQQSPTSIANALPRACCSNEHNSQDGSSPVHGLALTNACPSGARQLLQGSPLD